MKSLRKEYIFSWQRFFSLRNVLQLNIMKIEDNKLIMQYSPEWRYPRRFEESNLTAQISSFYQRV